MPCERCGVLFTNNIPKECRSHGPEGEEYCSDVCKEKECGGE